MRQARRKWPTPASTNQLWGKKGGSTAPFSRKLPIKRAIGHGGHGGPSCEWKKPGSRSVHLPISTVRAYPAKNAPTDQEKDPRYSIILALSFCPSSAPHWAELRPHQHCTRNACLTKQRPPCSRQEHGGFGLHFECSPFKAAICHAVVRSELTLDIAYGGAPVRRSRRASSRRTPDARGPRRLSDGRWQSA